MINSIYECNYPYGDSKSNSQLNMLLTRLFGFSISDDGDVVGVRNEYKFIPGYGLDQGADKLFTHLDVDLISYIEDTYDDNFYILLNDTLEGNWDPKWLDKLHTDLKKSTIDPTTIYYFTNTLDASERYEKYCIERNIAIKNRINFFAFPFILLQVWMNVKLFKKNKSTKPIQLDRLARGKPESGGDVNTWTKYKNTRLERDFSIIPQKKFVNLNNIKKPHRQIIVDFIRNSNFEENEIYYSAGWEKKFLHGMGDLTEIEKYYNSWNDELNIYESKIPDDMMLSHSNILESTVSLSSYFDIRPFYWDTFFSIVSETLPGVKYMNGPNVSYVENKEVSSEYRLETTTKFPFMTDKITGAILCSSLFLLVAERGALKFLRKWGFKTFSEVIDESYDDEPDVNKRINMIKNQVSELYNKSNEELYDILLAAEDIINYNFRYIQEPSFILESLQESLKDLLDFGRTPYYNPDEIYISIYDDVGLHHSNMKLFDGCQKSLKFILINPKEDKLKKYIHFINIGSPGYFNDKKLENIDNNILNDNINGRCSIIFYLPYEGQSGMKESIKPTDLGESESKNFKFKDNNDLEIIEKWINTNRLNPDNIYYFVGNFIVDEIAKKCNISYNVIPTNVVYLWVTSSFYNPNDIDLKRYLSIADNGVSTSNYRSTSGTIVGEFVPSIGISESDLSFNPVDDRNLFLSYAHAPKKYRVDFYIGLLDKNLLERGKASLGSLSDSTFFYENKNDQQKFIELKNRSPLILDVPLHLEDDWFHYDHTVIFEHYTSTFISVVMETLIESNTVQLTEKIYKSITALHPFMVMGNPRYLESLKKLGFKTFDKWIDESYDRETDYKKRASKILFELEKFSKYSIEKLKLIRKDMLPICEHNRQILLDMINETKGLKKDAGFKIDRNIFNKFNDIYKKLEVKDTNK